MAYAPHEGPPPISSRLLPVIFNTVLRFDFLFWVTSKFAYDTLVKALLATPPDMVKSAPPEEKARARLIINHLLPVSQRRKGLVNDGAISSALQRYELERITMPTLLLSTEDDLFGTYANARYTAEHIPGARFVGYPTGGHVWISRNDQVVREIVTFLKAQSG